MTILTIILGVLMIISGAACLWSPVMTWAGAEYMALTITAVIMLVYGVIGIIRAAADKEYGVNMIFAVLSIIAGGVMFIPGMRFAFESMALYVIAIWFILKGLTTIFMSLNLKRVDKYSKRWIWGVVIGVIGLLLGIYTFIHPLVIAGTLGLLISFYLIETGVNLIIMASGSVND